MNPNLLAIWEIVQATVFVASSQPDGKRPYFNPYNDFRPSYEPPSAPDVRRNNLHNYFEHFLTTPSILILGEAPGYRGCSFSGVPFTDEQQLTAGRLPFQGRRSSSSEAEQKTNNHKSAKTPRSPEGYWEASARFFWGALSKHTQEFLVWNIFPFHPHQPGEPLSNRKPLISETTNFIPFLERLVDQLQPKQTLAVGRFAETMLRRNKISCLPIRHPSHGGSVLFVHQMEEIFEKKGAHRD